MTPERASQLRGLGDVRFCVRAADVDPGDALGVGRLGRFNRADEPEVSVIGMLDEIVHRVRTGCFVIKASARALRAEER
jgi:hypothetical protein